VIICEICGSANTELDEQCRVCGQAFVKDQGEPQAVPVQAGVAAAQAAPATPPPIAQAPAAHVFEASLSESGPVSAPPPVPQAPAASPPDQRTLGMSAIAQPVEATAPPMLHGASKQDDSVSEPDPGSAVPSFMLAGNRTTAPEPEPVQLISANDLPDWIKQIAAEDAAKSEAEAKAAQNHVEPPATIVKKALPGETQVASTSTAWLSKSGQTTDSPDHWAATEVANAHWGNVPAAPSDVPEYPTIIPPTAFVPSVGESTPSSGKKRLSLSSRRAARAPKAPKSASASAGRPIYRKQSVQLAALLAMLAVLAVLLLT
jgi:hypothetical protein